MVVANIDSHYPLLNSIPNTPNASTHPVITTGSAKRVKRIGCSIAHSSIGVLISILVWSFNSIDLAEVVYRGFQCGVIGPTNKPPQAFKHAIAARAKPNIIRFDTFANSLKEARWFAFMGRGRGRRTIQTSRPKSNELGTERLLFGNDTGISIGHEFSSAHLRPLLPIRFQRSRIRNKGAISLAHLCLLLQYPD